MTHEEIVRRLEAREWFASSSQAIRDRLSALPAECDGFLEHLANRPSEGGGVRILSIHDVLIPDGKIFGIFINFNVQNIATLTQYRYQYFCWRQGPRSGAKGVLLVEHKSQITHVIVLRGFSFAVGADTYSCVGGFSEGSEMMLRLGDTFKREVMEELGLPAIRLTRIIELGTVHPDAGMTPNCVSLFAGVVDAQDATNIASERHINSDEFETRSGAVIVPVKDLFGEDGFVTRNSDGMFLAMMARLACLLPLSAFKKNGVQFAPLTDLDD